MNAESGTEHPRTAGLPHVDELSTPIGADRERTWSAIVYVLRRNLQGAGRGARLLGRDPGAATASFAGLEGQTSP